MIEIGRAVKFRRRRAGKTKCVLDMGERRARCTGKLGICQHDLITVSAKSEKNFQIPSCSRKIDVFQANKAALTVPEI
jgi:hypothetical protein